MIGWSSPVTLALSPAVPQARGLAAAVVVVSPGAAGTDDCGAVVAGALVAGAVDEGPLDACVAERWPACEGAPRLDWPDELAGAVVAEVAGAGVVVVDAPVSGPAAGFTQSPP